MNILVPINSKDDIHSFCVSGAKELYIGFYDPLWESSFGEYYHLNRMSGFGTDANRNTLAQLHEIIELTHIENAQIYIVLNAASYTKAQLAKISQYMTIIAEMGADGVIISCHEAAEEARKVGIASVASTMCGIYNHDIARSYIDLGVKRIILPRELSLDEIESLTAAAPEAEYEVFLMRSGCKFSDSHCLGYHRPEHPAPCRELKFSNCSMCSNSATFETRQLFNLNYSIYSQLYEFGACGQCALYRLQKAGITAGKIVGRADNPVSICQDISITATNLNIASMCTSEEEYLSLMMYPEKHERLCFLGKSCYYPEVRFRKEAYQI